VAAHEIMIGTPAIRNLIRENKVAQMYSAIQTGSSLGMQTLDQCLTDLVRRNIISRPRRVQGQEQGELPRLTRASLRPLVGPQLDRSRRSTGSWNAIRHSKFMHDLLR
jgi:hypothetical protein